MRFYKKTYKHPSHFNLNKWFLDFVDENGTAMIFYSAELKWHGIKIPYSSCLHCDEAGNIIQKSRFRNVQLPSKDENKINWADSKFGVGGVWQSSSVPVSAKIVESDAGYLDWKCYQPASEVKLEFDGKVIYGKGYAEQLLLTIPVWEIPMNELRWGHFGAENDHVVWIELKGEKTEQWLWLNGDRIFNCKISDELILIPDKNISIKLDRAVVLESEKKILSVVEKLRGFIPGLKKIIPLNFLLADESKWLSKAALYKGVDRVESGFAIHEYVNFNPSEI